MSRSDHPSLMPLPAALDMILGELTEEVTGVETIALDDASGRVLAEDVVSPIQVPPADNSAVDGYVVTSDLCGQADQQTKTLVARIPAGVCPSALPKSAVARIFTGATIPEGGASVVMQENCQTIGEKVVLPAKIKTGQNIRLAGQDITANSVILTRGSVVRPQDSGLVASIGQSQLRVKPKLRVAVFSTGDELVEPGETAPAGKIYNSNRYTLSALLNKLSVEMVDLGIIPDNYDATVEALTMAAKADLIISSGGVSVGEEDYVKAALEQMGRLDLWKLAIKPGKPLAFGKVGSTPFLGLPGNPTAVFVTFCLVATKVIAKLSGIEVDKSPPAMMLPARFDVARASNREDYIRVRLREQEGAMGLERYSNQSSGVLSSVSWADGFAVVPIGQTVKKGDLIKYLSYASFGL